MPEAPDFLKAPGGPEAPGEAQAPAANPAANAVATSALRGQMARFALVGIAGLLVDLLVLYLAMAAGAGWYGGRALSFLCAVAVTWQINRRFTFRADSVSLWREWWRYLLAMSGGGALNYATYSLLVYLAPGLPALGLVGVCAGSLAGMGANFIGARYFVFHEKYRNPP